ncbi:MAG: tetratricopeptide repeat protein [Candidatus Accumulibacter sp.]|jgi:predicted negative regulator of RcsB-dependent stress response|uniref:YfgM family protein n=1 Tax=unclassified Candidatus Accumulibacter TaxID=2619054 RepID=UPI001A3E1562|nr:MULTISPECIES: tetratricopeptide repeat protein [unclassified Candidatus Accumulibacter]MBL8367363.1 tetratricopeptide repeat protein [Accumulibacter sp.]MBN8514603.1 tetratricopeptide repeat protein [Accumulibacter sp.]MBO3701931.1 tetratricopeptide repeat protein [Accumulibacter sp.]HRI90135.1 tetratricopeptide repeat protein [Accumulibacter sp.]
MATYDLEEQEQIAEIKAWWKQYGNLVVAIVTAASIGVIAWQGWNWYQRGQAAKASMVYGVLQKAVADQDLQRVKAASGELLEKFGGTAYAPLAALSAAKVMFDAGDAKTAKLQLLWVVDHGEHELRDLARLRVAAVLLDEKAYDEALRQLEGGAGAGFSTLYLNMRGDLFSAQGKKSEAREAYQGALARLDQGDAGGKGKNTLQASQANAAYREVLQLKLDTLGEGS